MSSTASRRRPASWAAFGFSISAHLAVLAAFGPFAVSAPRPGMFDTIEITLATESALEAAPKTAAAPEPAPARRPEISREPEPGEAHAGNHDDAAPAATETTSPKAGSEAMVESRYDVTSLNNPKPPYPLAARRHGAQGRVILSVQVNAQGIGNEVRLKRSSGHAILDNAALQTVQRWRFVPARRGDTPVDSWVDVPIIFRLEG